MADTITFDTGDTTGYTLGGSNDFGGAASTLSAAPPAGGSGNAAAVLKTAGAETWAGTTFLTLSGSELATAAGHVVTMKVWSPDAGTVVRLKLEDAHNGANTVETDAVTTVAGAWQTLTFDLSKNAAGTAAFNDAFTYDKASLFFDFGKQGSGKTYYFDDVAYTATAVTAPTPTPAPGGTAGHIGFEAGEAPIYMLGGSHDFGGAASSLSTTPPAGGSGQAAAVLKTAGAETWAGTTFLAFSGQELATSADHVVTMKVWSPDAGTVVRLKLEDTANGTHSVETDAVTTVAGAWQTLSFDLTKTAAGTPAFSDASTYNQASLFFDFGQAGSGKTYYFDDVSYTATPVAATTPDPTPTPTPTPTLPVQVSFDSGDTSGYSLAGTSDFGGAVSSLSEAPPAGATGNAAQVLKTAGAEVWAGTTFLTLGEGEFVTAANHVVTIKVWSPDAGTVVRLKFEDQDNSTHSVETDAVTTKAGAWETLTFDLSKNAAGTAALNDDVKYDKGSLFFDFGHAGAGKTYYFDDVAFVPNGPPPPVQITFEANDVSGYSLGGASDFGGAASSLAESAPDGGSGHAAKVVKTAGAETWAGTTFQTLGDKEFVTAANHVVTVKVWSPDAGTVVLLKFEDVDNGTHSVETSAVTTVAGGWQTLTFDLSKNAAGTQALNDDFTYNKGSLFFDFGNKGSGKTYYFDDVAYTPTPLGGTGPDPEPDPNPEPVPVPTPPTVHVTFDTGDTSGYVLGKGHDAGGAVSSLARTPPAGGSGQAAKVVKAAGADAMASTTFLTLDGTEMATTLDHVATLKVWSPDAGTEVRLRLEDKADTSYYVESAAVTTAAGWQTLSFDFLKEAPNTQAFDDAANYDQVAVIFDAGHAGTGKTYYFDDLAYTATALVPPAPPVLPEPPVSKAQVTFDKGGAAYVLGKAADFGGAVSSLTDKGPGSHKDQVAKVVKKAGAEDWAGTTFATSDHLVTTSHHTMTMQVWSPDKGSVVRLMLTDAADASHTVEADAVTTVAKGWQTLRFDFPSTAGSTQLFDNGVNFNKATVYFDFGRDGTGKTYYFDDVANTAAASGLPVLTLDNVSAGQFNAKQDKGDFLVTGTVRNGSMKLEKANTHITETPASGPLTITKHMVADVADAGGAQAIHIAKGGVLNLRGADGVNDVYFDAYDLNQLNVSRVGTTAVFTDAKTHEQVASIATDAVHAPKQVMHFGDIDLALTDDGGSLMLNGVAITVVGANVGASGALFYG